MSQWYRNKSYLYGGKYTDLNDFIRSEWEAGFVANWDANDMLTLLRTWQTGDVSKVKAVAPSLQGDLAGVLRNIKAKGLIMPSKTDLYFPVSPPTHLHAYRNSLLLNSPRIARTKSPRWGVTLQSSS